MVGGGGIDEVVRELKWYIGVRMCVCMYIYSTPVIERENLAEKNDFGV